MIIETINKLHMELPAAAKLVAVSKFHPFEAIEEAYSAGQRVFAESRPQELLAKVNVDGGLIGGASLKTDKFTAIVKAAN